MCGIVGARHDWLESLGLEPAAAIAQATEALAWRGPDGLGVERAGPWHLGCARLAISGPDYGQPVVRRGKRFAGVLNGAITNARERFGKRLASRKTLPNDAWLPLLAVANNEHHTLNNLRGHHAYAVADAKTGELVLGQDTYGEKPLHCLVARVGDGWQLVAFASTPAALRHLGMPTQTGAGSSRRLAEWFRYGWSIDRPHRFSTRLKLQSLPARGQPFATSNAPSANWCRPCSDNVASTNQPASNAADSLRKQLAASVSRCLDSPSAVGLSLSGGVDSSCLALALADLGKQIPAYQFRADGASETERTAAQATAAAARLHLHPVNGGPELLNELPRLTKLAGQPLGDPSILAVHAVAQQAAHDGVRILLGGEGADELLLGYARYRAAGKIARLAWLRSFPNGKIGPRWSMHKTARLWRAATDHNPIRALLAVAPPAFAETVLTPELGARQCWRNDEPRVGGATPALAARADDLANYLPRDLLPKIDIALLAAGIEGRCPYLDPAVAQFGRDESALGKQPLRHAFASDLPEAVTRLPKFGFALPLDNWFRSHPETLDLLAESRSRDRQHLAAGGLVTAVDRHRSGKANIGHALYLLLAYELHLRAEEPESTPASPIASTRL